MPPPTPASAGVFRLTVGRRDPLLLGTSKARTDWYPTGWGCGFGFSSCPVGETAGVLAALRRS